jgi:hypothetical protein
VGQGLLIGSLDGLHRLNDRGYTKIVTGTAGHHFIPSSVLVSPESIAAVSHLGLLNIRQRATVVKPDVISYVKTASGIMLNPNSVDVNQSDFVDIAFTDYDYTNRQKRRYQYRINNNEWHTLVTPLVHINELSQGVYTIEYRKAEKGAAWAKPCVYAFNVIGPWYSSNVAYGAYSAAVILLLLAIIYFVVRWNRSFHRVFKSEKIHSQQNGLNEAIAKLSKGINLVSGNETQLTDGLVKLDEAADLLIPIAINKASLGTNELEKGLGLLKAACLAQYMNKDIGFEIALGNKQLPQQLQCDAYAVVYYALKKAVQQEACDVIQIHVYREKHSLVVATDNDGPATGRLRRLVDFELEEYCIKQIAKDSNTKAIWKNKPINSVVVKFPINTVEQRDKHLRLVS